MDQNGTSSVNSNVVVVGIVKDVAKTIDSDYLRLKNALKRFEHIKWFLVESNSTDDSKQVLFQLSMSDSSFRFVSIADTRQHKSRIPGMALARNTYLEELRVNSEYSDCNFVVVADFNQLNDLIDANAIDSCFSRADWDVICANQEGPYYDIWALRHPLWSPNDCWQELEFLRKYIKFPERALYAAVQSRMIKIPRNSDWIEVESAFGGLAIYKRDAMLQSEYSPYDDSGAIICEHVTFNLRLRAHNKKIYINPALINTRYTDHNSETKLRRKFIRYLKYPLKYLRKINE